MSEPSEEDRAFAQRLGLGDADARDLELIADYREQIEARARAEWDAEWKARACASIQAATDGFAEAKAEGAREALERAAQELRPVLSLLQMVNESFARICKQERFHDHDSLRRALRATEALQAIHDRALAEPCGPCDYGVPGPCSCPKPQAQPEALPLGHEFYNPTAGDGYCTVILPIGGYCYRHKSAHRP